MTVARDRDGHAWPVSSSVLGHVMETHRPYLACTVIAVPLSYQAGDTEWLGAIVLDVVDEELHPRDLELLEAIAGPTALAIKNAMLVRHIQSVIGDEWRRHRGIWPAGRGCAPSARSSS